MAKVYTLPKSFKKQEPIAQEFTLVDLMHGIPNHNNPMVREGHCYVTGIQFVFRGEEGYKHVLASAIEQLRRLDFSDEQLQRATQLLQEKEFLMVNSAFYAMRYTNTDGTPMADGCPYQGFVTNMRHIGIIHFDTKEITITPFGDAKDGQHKNLFYDVVGAKLAGSRWQYDGNMVDALTEFSNYGFSFNQGRHPNSLTEVVDFNLLRHPPGRRYITVKARIPLEEALSTIS